MTNLSQRTAGPQRLEGRPHRHVYFRLTPSVSSASSHGAAGQLPCLCLADVPPVLDKLFDRGYYYLLLKVVLRGITGCYCLADTASFPAFRLWQSYFRALLLVYDWSVVALQGAAMSV